MNQVIAVHGWAGDAMVWRTWQRRFEHQGWHWQSFERGYGTHEPHQPRWSQPNRGQRVVMAHSLGLHLIPSAVLSGASAVVSLACFSRFVPDGPAGRRLRTALKGMESKLGTPEEAGMLQTFLERCALPHPVTALPANPLLQGLAPPGRERLQQDLVMLQRCQQLPADWPAQAAVLVVQGEQDVIVCDQSRKALLQALPSGRIQQISLPDDGHALVTPAVLALVQNWLEKV
ncbi:MAG: alpha/beta hydrolase [Cyanobacteriota bacterium]|nr:alpha/beta hydrolase [Cyanobacteriota bacterium]